MQLIDADGRFRRWENGCESMALQYNSKRGKELRAIPSL